MALIEIRNLTKIFPPGESPFGGRSRSEILAVDDVSLDIHAGETLGLVGESGSGKSTLGRLILRLIEPTSGTIRYEGRDLLAASGSRMRRLRRDLQIIFQDPFASLDPRFRVEDIIAEPLIIHRSSCGDGRPRKPALSDPEHSEGESNGSGRAKLDGGNAHREGHDFSRAGDAQESEAVSGSAPLLAAFARSGSESTPPLSRSLRRDGANKASIRARVIELLRAVGLDESALRRYPHEFSGGQRQRIGIARALALRPKFIVCDEPVSALDVSVGAQIVNLLAQLQRDFGLTYLFISHSMPVVRYLSTRIAVMCRGKIVEVGETAQITERPQHAYTRSLLEVTPELTA